MRYAAIIAVLVALTSGAFADVTLLQASNPALPSAQEFYYLDSALTLTDRATPTPGGFIHSSTEAESSGYFNQDTVIGSPLPAMPPKVAVPTDRTGDGFTVEVDMQTVTETHGGSAHRAGFSIIVLSDDSWGIELGFWDDLIFAQNDNFTQGESISVDTTSAIATYSLSVKDNSYYLQVDGIMALQGALRNYSANPAVTPVMTNPLHPYALTGFVFFGDNTSSAGGEFIVGDINVLDAAVVPEPATMALLATGGAVVLVRRRRRA